MIHGNNPGNIRRVQGHPWVGELVPSPWVPGFVTFDTLANGFRALLKLLQTYISKHGADTITKIITRWAPPSENPTANYIQFVSDSSGISPYTQLSPSDLNSLTRIAAGIADFENSGQLTSSDYTALNTAAGNLTGNASPSNESQSAALPAIIIILIALGALFNKRL